MCSGRRGGSLGGHRTVTVQGTPASVTAANAFSVSLPVATGTTTIAVAATDASGNTATKQYEIRQCSEWAGR